jgi:hypothetical protein
MGNIFFILALISMVGVVISMISGIFSMSKGSQQGSRKSNKMMQMRVICQGSALLFLLLAYFTKS